MSLTSGSSALVLAMVLVASLAACTAPTDIQPEPSASATPPGDPAPYGGIELSPDSLGSLTIGEPAMSGLLRIERGACVVEFAAGAKSDPDLWVADFPDLDELGSPAPFGVLVSDDGMVTVVGVSTSEIETTEGVRLGSTVEEVIEAYPEAVVVDELLYTVEGERGVLVIEVAAPGSGVDSGTVVLLRSQELGSAIERRYATDGMWGYCNSYSG